MNPTQREHKSWVLAPNIPTVDSMKANFQVDLSNNDDYFPLLQGLGSNLNTNLQIHCLKSNNTTILDHKRSLLLGGCTNPSEKYARQIGWLPPNRDETYNMFELPPPTQLVSAAEELSEQPMERGEKR